MERFELNTVIDRFYCALTKELCFGFAGWMLRDASVSANRAAIYPSVHLLQNPGKHTAFMQLGLT